MVFINNWFSFIIIFKTVFVFKVNTTKSNDASNSSGTDGGLNVISAAIFVAAEMAGSGVLAIPKAVVNCGMHVFLVWNKMR